MTNYTPKFSPNREVHSFYMLEEVHLKLCKISLHNVTHSITSRDPRERKFVVQTSLLLVTFLSLISQILSLMQTTKEVNPHPHIALCVNM